LGCYLSEVSPDSMAVPVENVCMYNNFLNEIIRCLCARFISTDRMLGGSLTTNMAHTFSFFVGGRYYSNSLHLVNTSDIK
jgi:hypothetical protein